MRRDRQARAVREPVVPNLTNPKQAFLGCGEIHCPIALPRQLDVKIERLRTCGVDLEILAVEQGDIKALDAIEPEIPVVASDRAVRDGEIVPEDGEIIDPPLRRRIEPRA